MSKNKLSKVVIDQRFLDWLEEDVHMADGSVISNYDLYKILDFEKEAANDTDDTEQEESPDIFGT